MTSEMLLEQFYGGAELKLTHSGTLGRPKSSPEAFLRPLQQFFVKISKQGIMESLTNTLQPFAIAAIAQKLQIQRRRVWFTQFLRFLLILRLFSCFSRRRFLLVL